MLNIEFSAANNLFSAEYWFLCWMLNSAPVWRQIMTGGLTHGRGGKNLTKYRFVFWIPQDPSRKVHEGPRSLRDPVKTGFLQNLNIHPGRSKRVLWASQTPIFVWLCVSIFAELFCFDKFVPFLFRRTIFFTFLELLGFNYFGTFLVFSRNKPQPGQITHNARASKTSTNLWKSEPGDLWIWFLTR